MKFKDPCNQCIVRPICRETCLDRNSYWEFYCIIRDLKEYLRFLLVIVSFSLFVLYLWVKFLFYTYG